MTRRHAHAIINPASDGGGTGRAWPGIAQRAAALGLELVEHRTEAPGHAGALVRDALAAGAEAILIVGGDGTVHEVVDGLGDDERRSVSDQAAIAVLERGTGCDFIRTHGIPKKVDGALRVLMEGREVRVDLGRATLVGPDGAPVVQLFANVGSCGITGDVAVRAEAGTKRLGGTAGFLLATVQAFRAWSNCGLVIEADGQRRELRAAAAACAIGRAFGGGIRIAPQADPSDGEFDLVTIGDVGKLDLARNVHRLYLGTLGRHPKVDEQRARTVRIEAERPLPVELDGELPGTTPVTFEVLPGALRLLVP